MKAADWSAIDDRLIPLAGRRDEVLELVGALRTRQSRLITGSPGMGKTRLLAEAVCECGAPYLLRLAQYGDSFCDKSAPLPRADVGRPILAAAAFLGGSGRLKAGCGQNCPPHKGQVACHCIMRAPIVIRGPRVLHDLLTQLAGILACGVTGATTMSLKPAVLESLKREPRAILLEDMEDADPRMYRFLQAIYHSKGNSLIVTARSRESLGYVRRLLWDPREEIRVQPLKRAEAAGLFDAAVAAHKLESLDLDGFRSQVLRSARGNPGQIVAMCRLAARPEYRLGRRVKFLPLRMDALPAFIG